MAHTVAEVMTREPVTIRRDDTVARAAQLMRENDTGDVIVVEGSHVVGVVTDRDIAIRVVAEDAPPSTAVREASSGQDIATISPAATLEQAASTMREKAVRRLPVVEEGRLVGVISLGDVAIEREADTVADISAAEPNV
jgi:CBS domain-containing protein